MPSSTVRTAADERKWQAAKKVVRDEYGEVRWPVVQHVYNSMKGGKNMAKSKARKNPGPDLIQCFGDADCQEMLESYVETALWSSSIEEDGAIIYAKEFGGEPPTYDSSFEYLNYDIDDIEKKSLDSMAKDCAAFLRDNLDDVVEFMDKSGSGLGSVGHNFWLDRNGHGAGFWDVGVGAVGDRLSEASYVYGESYLYLGDDGKVHIA